MKDVFYFVHMNDEGFVYKAVKSSKWEYLVLWVDHEEPQGAVYGVKLVQEYLEKKIWREVMNYESNK